MTALLRLLACLLPLAAITAQARDYPKIILILGDTEALGSPQASETRMEEVPIGTHMAEMWKQVPFTFAGKFSHSISSGSGDSHIPPPKPDDPLTEPRTWWQTLTRQPTADPRKSHWGAEIGLARDLHDRGYRNFRIVKYTYNHGLPDETFRSFMKDVLAFPAFDVSSFDRHPFEIAALVHFQKSGDSQEKIHNLYQSIRNMLPQTRHMKMFSVAHPSNPAPPPSLRPGFYRLEIPAGFESQEQVENIANVPSHDLSRLPTGALTAQGLMTLGQRLAHHMVLYRTFRPPEARSILSHDPVRKIVTEQFVDEQDRPKRQAEAYDRIAYHYAHGRVTRLVFDGDEDNALVFSYSDENTLDQVRDPKTDKPLYLSAAGSYTGPNGLPMRLPMLTAKAARLNGVGRCASSPLSPWLWFNMTKDMRSTQSNLPPNDAYALRETAEDESLRLPVATGLLEEQESPLTIYDIPPGPHPPAKLMPGYTPGGLRGSFGNFHQFKFCCAMPCAAVLYPLDLRLPPIIEPEPEANFFDPTLACLPTPVGLRLAYETTDAIPPVIAPEPTMPRFLARKLLQQGVRCPSLDATSIIPIPTASAHLLNTLRDTAKSIQREIPNQTGLFVPFPMETFQFLERLPKPPSPERTKRESKLEITYEKIGSPGETLGKRRVPTEFKYTGSRLSPFTSKSTDHDDAGRVVRETYLDGQGNPAPGPDMWSAKVQMFSPEGLLLQASYLDCNQNLCYNSEGFSEVIHTYNTHRQLLSTEYFSPGGTPVTHLKLGYAAVDMTYRVGGVQLLSKRYFNTHNVPANQKWGYAQIRYGYDKLRQHLTSIRFLDQAGKPCPHLAGHWGVNYTYSSGITSSPKPTTETLVDKDDFPIMCRYGYASIAHEYDSRGNLLNSHYLDADGKPGTTTAGYHTHSLEYNEDGLLSLETYTGSIGEPVRTPWIWARRECSYNEDGKLLEEKFFNSDGSPVNVASGYSRILHAYNPEGDLTGIAYMNASGNLVLGPERFGMRKYRHTRNPQNQSLLESSTCYGYRSTEPITNSAGHTHVKYSYDSANRCIREDYSSEDNLPGALPVSISSNTRQYDEYGREIHREHQSASGQKRIGPGGAFSRSAAYDLLGRTVHTQTHDCGGSPCPANSHISTLTRDYQPDGVSFSEQYFHAEGVTAISERGIPGRMFSYQTDLRAGSPPTLLELYLTDPASAPVIDRHGRAGRSFELDANGQPAREFHLNAAQHPASNSLGYGNVVFTGSSGTFTDDNDRPKPRPDGNAFITLSPDGKLSYSARSPEGFRSRTSGNPDGSGSTRLEFESTQAPHFHPFRNYDCRGCGTDRVFVPRTLILGPDRHARESVLYQKDGESSSSPIPGFTRIVVSYEDASNTPVMNRWNFAKVIQEFDELGQLKSESFQDTAGRPVITTSGFSMAEYHYQDGYLTGKTFTAE